MWFFVCWLVLGMLFICHGLIRRRWITGQTAFTGVWFASLSALWIFPATGYLISREATLMIICVHTSFFLGSIAISILPVKRKFKSPMFTPTTKAKKALRYIAWVAVSVGVAGSMLAVLSSGAFVAYQEGTLIMMRSMLLTQEMEIPTYARVMTNFLYPASLLCAICFLFAKPSPWSWFYIFLPIVGSLLYGFAFGGRGAVLITSPIIFWVLAIGFARPFGTRKHRLLLFCALLLVFLFTGLIAETRMDFAEIGESLLQYFTGSIPSFSEWLKINPISLVNYDFSNTVIVREVVRLFGVDGERAIGLDVVFVPFQFNVFTHLAEHVRDFGIIGAILVSHLLGIFSALLESKRLSETLLGLRALVYTYLSFSLFADLSFFVVGWWLALFIIVFLLPFWKALSIQFPRLPASYESRNIFHGNTGKS